jgi:hypothetical protein
MVYPQIRVPDAECLRLFHNIVLDPLIWLGSNDGSLRVSHELVYNVMKQLWMTLSDFYPLLVLM